MRGGVHGVRNEAAARGFQGMCGLQCSVGGWEMTDDLVKHLRDFKEWIRLPNGIVVYTGWEAAARIEMLEAALKKIARHDMQAIAIDALSLRLGERIRAKQ